MSSKDNKTTGNLDDTSNVADSSNLEDRGNPATASFPNINRDQLSEDINKTLAQHDPLSFNLELAVQDILSNRLPSIVEQVVDALVQRQNTGSGPGKAQDVDENHPRKDCCTPAAHLACGCCQAIVPLPPSAERWYTIWVGRRVGWVRGWEKMDPLTRGVSGQAMLYCESATAARALFSEKLRGGLVVVAPGFETVNFTLDPGEGELFP